MAINQELLAHGPDVTTVSAETRSGVLEGDRRHQRFRIAQPHRPAGQPLQGHSSARPPWALLCLPAAHCKHFQPGNGANASFLITPFPCKIQASCPLKTSSLHLLVSSARWRCPQGWQLSLTASGQVCHGNIHR